ncbi:Signal transduction histidine kinase [Chitinispirillum alkaliphilum]|nr:Signal transduction histidine kinase [Chitinispirillum alkaliphilum]
MDNCETDIRALLEENKGLRETLQNIKETQEQLVNNEKMASVGRLSAGIAHEINNPIGFVSSNCTTLKGYITRIKEILEMYRRDIPKAFIAKQEKKLKLEMILTDVDALLMENIEGLARITTIVNNLKKFSRDEQQSEFTEADINESISTVIIISRNEVKYHADIVTDFGDVGAIECNISELNQVFLNIIVNAAQAIKEMKREQKGTIHITTYRDDLFVYCKIVDDGPGIPEEIRQKIFDPFFTTKEVGIGTGLGLSISYEIIVNKHKGELSVESEKGKGTTFLIKLPRNQEILS